ncbi:acetamidase/Formamidase family protein [Striga asiatica]|uniref:Acetamidase/Formamidase family protein n=1 Tax=Striga asiatica TaxID=4170 RepID=A0A5A7PU07_STRAF|nr:acetamidase/Formamidase family protein [Striga asiatica]
MHVGFAGAEADGRCVACRRRRFSGQNLSVQSGGGGDVRQVGMKAAVAGMLLPSAAVTGTAAGRGRLRQGGCEVVPVDLTKKPWDQKLPLHNRWHPDIPPVAEVRTGELFRVEMVDFSGGAITKEYTAHDIKFADPSVVSSSILVNFACNYCN